MKTLWNKFLNIWLGEDTYPDWKTMYAELQMVCLTIQSENRELRDTLDDLMSKKPEKPEKPKVSKKVSKKKAAKKTK